MDKLLSIIVPVYKAEKHLDRCVESILSQTYGNIELVLVDDGSPDASPAMCDSWAKRDWRVRVIHKKNNGADLPLKNQDEIHRYFDEHKGEEFVHFGAPEPTEKELERVRYYHFASGRRNFFNRLVTQAETALERIFGINRIKGKKMQRGSQWFSVTGEFAKYLISQKSFVFKQFKHTYIPDEFFVQTVIINSSFADNLHSKKFDDDHEACLRYIDWTRGHPYTFKSEDYDELMNSGCLFARKFSIVQDDKIVRKITSAVLNG